MKFKILIILFTFSLIKMYATSQAPDIIIINNKEYSVLNNPLEKFFENNPEYHPIYGSKLTLFKKYKNRDMPIPFSTGNYRGYIATFKIENNMLVLADLTVKNIDSKKREYISVYKQLFKNKKVVLNYSGILIIPTGQLIEAVNFGYSSLYDRYKLMTINNDTVVKEKELNKDEFIKFKLSQFEEYKKTEDYKTELKKYIEDPEDNKKPELSKENTKGTSKKEITALKKEDEQPSTEEHIDGFLFMIKNPDFVIVDY